MHIDHMGLVDAADFCSSVLSQFSDSMDDSHVHICTAIGEMSQELKDQKFPLSPVAYFGLTCSSLQRLSTAEAEESPAHITDALSTILSLAIYRISKAALLKQFDYVSNLIIRILRLKRIGEQGIISCLKCNSYLLIVREKASWVDIAELYGLLLGFVADGRPKVRKQSHICLHEVLEKYQNSSSLKALLSPASEAIRNAFERSLLLTGGSNENSSESPKGAHEVGSNKNSSEGPKGAREVLYILDALKICLPFMNVKSSMIILKYFKTLLELRQPLVTRCVTDAINALCIHPTEVSPEVLLDLLCSLAMSISTNESSADNTAFTVRLLAVGMKRIYLLNRQICVVKLPLVFSTLSDVLLSEHEEALLAAKEAFKSLINVCIDENCIKKGVDQVVLNSNDGTRTSIPTIVEKVCATVESLLDYQYAAVWDISLEIVSTMFDKLGQYSSYFLKRALINLAEMQKLPDEDFPYRKRLHECVGSAVGAMGPETFLSIVPLNLDSQNLSEANLWLFPILKHYIVGAHLRFFTRNIMSINGTMKQRSATLEEGGKIISARTADGIVYSLWSLLPSFCNYPLDTADSFKDLEKALNRVLHEEPDIHGIICSSLHILIEQNKNIAEGKEDPSYVGLSIHKERAITHYNTQVASDNLSVIRVSASKLLPLLSGAFMNSSKDTIGPLQMVIGDLASISDKKVLTGFFSSTMRKLLKVTQEASKMECSKDSNAMQVDSSSGKGSLPLMRAQLFDLAVSLLPGLDSKEIDLLFNVIASALKDDERLVQKRAYKVLSIMLQKSDEFTSRRLEELLNVMIGALPACHFSAKRHRLDCLYFLIVHISKDNFEQRRREVVASFLTEILLALKEANKRTRNRAYDILVQIGHACVDEERGGKKEHLERFFNMVAGGLAGETPHMISAATKGLARLAYEFTDLVVASFNVLPSAFLLLRTKNKEIIKANLGLLKVLVAKSEAEGLHSHLRGMVESLMSWQDSTKSHFKAKVKLLLEMLIKKCGLDDVKAVMPEELVKLLTNIRKIKERRERKSNGGSDESRSHISKATTSRLSRWNHTKVFSDFGNDSGAESAGTKSISGRRGRATSMQRSEACSLRSKKTRRASKSLQEDLFDQEDDEPLDLLDQQKTRSALRSCGNRKRKPESDDEEMEIDAEGHLIIREEDFKPKKKKPSLFDREAADGARSEVASSRKTQKRRKTTDSGWAYTGSEYASKKAGGDTSRKGKLEPYAYWPLDRKMISRRPEHRASARKGMSSVVRMTKNLEGKSVAAALSIKGPKLGKKKGSKRKAK